ncbi:MAG: hypothetical protein QOE48_1945 [Mycobacterium sp.]|jgi:hypothetical protein|nr:hypothetical protein [Mycobacterium sp.]
MGTERKGGKPAAPGERHVALVQPEIVSPQRGRQCARQGVAVRSHADPAAPSVDVEGWQRVTIRNVRYSLAARPLSVGLCLAVGALGAGGCSPGALGEEAHAVESDNDGGSFMPGDA